MQGLFNALLLSCLFLLLGLLLAIQVHQNKSFKLYGFVEFALSPYIMSCTTDLFSGGCNWEEDHLFFWTFYSGFGTSDVGVDLNGGQGAKGGRME